ncbi:MAG: hypothetical protein KOO63_05605 [Bacteroidales bacterium]|nr:hypothetical protein [Candidatus Latescibacterota bacterium]
MGATEKNIIADGFVGDYPPAALGPRIKTAQKPVSQYKGPAGTRVLIEPVDFKTFLYKSMGMDRSKSLIEIPDTVKDAHQQACEKGIIREIGACAWADQPGGTPWAEIGDLVDFVRHSGVEVQLDEKCKWRVVNDVDIYYNHGKQF